MLSFLKDKKELGATEACHSSMSHSVINRWWKKFEPRGVIGSKAGCPMAISQLLKT